MPMLKRIAAITIIILSVTIFWQLGGPTKHFENLKQINIDRSIHLNNESVYSFTNGMYEQGLEQLDKSLALYPNNSIALYNAGIFFIIFRTHISQVRYGDMSEWNEEKVLDEGIEYNERVLLLAPDDEDTMVHYAENMTFIYMIRQSRDIFDYETLRKAKNIWVRLYTEHPKRVYWTYVDTCTSILREAGHELEDINGITAWDERPDA